MASSDNNAPVLRNGEKKSNLEKIAEINQKFKERDIRGQAKQSGLPYIDLKNAPLNQDALMLVEWNDVYTSQTVPFDIQATEVKVACVNPESPDNQRVIEKVKNRGYTIKRYLCSPEGLASTERFYQNRVHTETVPVETATKEGELIIHGHQVFNEVQDIFEKGTGPEMINQMNLISVRFHASDVHFQPSENNVAIRMRRDGQLYEVYQITHKQYLLLNGEIKRASKLKANVKNIPQDGDYEFIANDRKISVRVSSLPSKYGESLVLRILDSEKAITQLESLGFSDSNKEIMLNHLEKERGLILVTGPTGSGKTSTLYSCLNFANKPEKKIITLEDPIEFELQNTVQSEIQEEEGYTFASGLRAILRQDPDVVMVGEIRDKEAAEIALQASLTGHLVLSTVHANDAISTIPRLYNMGLKPYILAAGLELIIAQRLVRKLCEHCKQPTTLDESLQIEIDRAMEIMKKRGVELPEQSIFEEKGCEKCANTGYEGRVAIAELLTISDDIRRAILAEESIAKVLEVAQQEGFLSLKEDGVLKVIQGLTTFEEVWRVLV